MFSLNSVFCWFSSVFKSFLFVCFFGFIVFIVFSRVIVLLQFVSFGFP